MDWLRQLQVNFKLHLITCYSINILAGGTTCQVGSTPSFSATAALSSLTTTTCALDEVCQYKMLQKKSGTRQYVGNCAKSAACMHDGKNTANTCRFQKYQRHFMASCWSCCIGVDCASAYNPTSLMTDADPTGDFSLTHIQGAAPSR